jgi:Fe2+ transport system protein B
MRKPVSLLFSTMAKEAMISFFLVLRSVNKKRFATPRTANPRIRINPNGNYLAEEDSKYLKHGSK